MKILFACSECSPFAASGGLADVAGSLPAALQKEGAECRVIMPLYGSIGPAVARQYDLSHQLWGAAFLAGGALRCLYHAVWRRTVLLPG